MKLKQQSVVQSVSSIDIKAFSKMASASTQVPQERFAYVAILNKPWNLVSNNRLEIDCGVTLMLHKGTFQDADIAQVIRPLGAGEMVAFPENSMTTSHAWGGRVDHLVANKSHGTHCMCATNKLIACVATMMIICDQQR